MSQRDYCAEGKCDWILSSSKINTGTPQTTLGQLGLAVRRGVGDGRWWISDSWHTNHKQNTHKHSYLCGDIGKHFTDSFFFCLTLICVPQLGHQILHLRTNLCCLCQSIRYQQHIYRHAADADAHLSYSSCPPCLQRGVFLRVISGSMLTETDGRTERGLAHQHKWRNLPLLFSFLLNNVNSRCWPLVSVLLHHSFFAYDYPFHIS